MTRYLRGYVNTEINSKGKTEWVVEDVLIDSKMTVFFFDLGKLIQL